MQRGAFRACRIAKRNGREKIGLALDCRRARAIGQVGERRGAAEIVGERHHGAAMHRAEPILDLVAHK